MTGSDQSAPEAPFDAPWQAQLFALTVALNEAGHFSWADWAATFGPMVQEQPAETYWQVWSEALVTLLSDLQIAEAAEVQRMAELWQAAARNTPHGTPIELSAASGS